MKALKARSKLQQRMQPVYKAPPPLTNEQRTQFVLENYLTGVLIPQDEYLHADVAVRKLNAFIAVPEKMCKVPTSMTAREYAMSLAEKFPKDWTLIVDDERTPEECQSFDTLTYVARDVVSGRRAYKRHGCPNCLRMDYVLKQGETGLQFIEFFTMEMLGHKGWAIPEDFYYVTHSSEMKYNFEMEKALSLFYDQLKAAGRIPS